jgi:hypothetical protein
VYNPANHTPMAYVPQYEADIFVSYAHADDGGVPWSKLLIAGLELEVRKRLGGELGRELQVWLDENDIRLADNWVDRLEGAIAGTATFLALVSPNYMYSDVCSREREAFLKVFDRDPQVALPLLARSRRFFKLIRLPLDNDEHMRFLPDVQHEIFYEGDAKSVASEMSPTSEAFRSRVLKCAIAIKDVLQGLRRQREKVFVASPADDCEVHWRSVQSELKRQGYDVHPPSRIDGTLSDELVRGRMEGSKLSIHLLGARYRDVAERQVRIAAELGLRQFIWLSKDAQVTTDERQKQLLKHLRDGRVDRSRDLPEGFSLLESGSLQSLYEDVLGALKQADRSRVAAAASDTPSVYLCCDRTTSTDASFALRLGGDIRETEGVDVHLPAEEASERRQHHERCLQQCDGVLVYSEAAPREWLSQVVEDVTYAENAFQRQPLRAKALLTPDVAPWTSYPLRPIAKKPQFVLSDLRPFLDSLRQPPSLGARA